MAALGYPRFALCAHDRGARVAHRLCMDHPEAVSRLMLLDIAPTLAMYERTSMTFAAAYWHWFFLIQPEPLPETLINAEPDFFLARCLGLGMRQGGPEPFAADALAAYGAAMREPARVHAMCEDYRASAGVVWSTTAPTARPGAGWRPAAGAVGRARRGRALLRAAGAVAGSRAGRQRAGAALRSLRAGGGRRGTGRGDAGLLPLRRLRRRHAAGRPGTRCSAATAFCDACFSYLPVFRSTRQAAAARQAVRRHSQRPG